MKQTAVEWLAEQITTVKWKMSDVTDRNSIIEQAKAMEKEQMKALYTMHIVDTRTMELFDFDEYYKQTYESKTNI